MLNVVAIMGRLVADPQLRQTTSGKNVASFRIACDRNGRRDANGQSNADFFDVVAWERSAEFVCRYFQKGSLIAIDGRLQSRTYQDKQGNNQCGRDRGPEHQLRGPEIPEPRRLRHGRAASNARARPGRLRPSGCSARRARLFGWLQRRFFADRG